MCRRRTLACMASDAVAASREEESCGGGESRPALEQVQESASKALEDLVVQLEDSVDNQVCRVGIRIAAFVDQLFPVKQACLLPGCSHKGFRSNLLEATAAAARTAFLVPSQEAENELEGIVGTYDFSEEEKDTFRSLVSNMRATATGLLAAAGVNVLFLIIKQVLVNNILFAASELQFVL